MTAGVDAAELAQLQQQVLRAVLTGGALAPDGPSLALPDLRFARDGAVVALSRDNLAAGFDAAGLPQPVRLVDPGERTTGALAFMPPGLDGDVLTLRLCVEAVPPGGATPVPLSAVSLRFRRGGGGWAPAGPPAVMST